MESLPGISVNGVKISAEEVNSEVQYHPSSNLFEAKYKAMKALVIREILIQRAEELGLCVRDDVIDRPDEVIERLLEVEITCPDADEESCRRYYDNNRQKFVTSPLFEVSHILYLAPMDDDYARREAKLKADATLARLLSSADLFEEIARSESACSSAKDGGRLGQISKGQTMAEFEKALFSMREGDISLEPVATEVGYHIIKVHAYAEGNELPFESVFDKLREDLTERNWEIAFSQYIQLLAGRAKIEGFRFDGVTSPLVQ